MNEYVFFSLDWMRWVPEKYEVTISRVLGDMECMELDFCWRTSGTEFHKRIDLSFEASNMNKKAFEKRVLQELELQMNAAVSAVYKQRGLIG